MKLLFISTVCVIVLTHFADAQCHYRVTILPTLDCGSIGQDGGTPMALNDYGQVAGKHSHCLGEGESAFAWSGGPTIGTIPLPPGVTSARAFDINNVLGSNGIGMVGGEAITPGPTPYRPFIWFNGQWQLLSYGKNTSPGAVFALNDHGLAVGYTSDGTNWIATAWNYGQPTHIQVPYGPRSIALSVSATGAVAGWMGVAEGIDSHAFIWKNGLVTDIGVIPDAQNAKAFAINRFGEVVVVGNTDHTQPPGYWSRAYLWRVGQWTDLGMLPGFNSTAGFSINDRREIVGISRMIGVPGLPETAWIWRNGILSDLSTLLLPGSGINPGVGGVRAINNEGQISAQASIGGVGSPLTGVTVVLTPVPDNAGDTNCDGLVNIDDLVNVITRWGPCGKRFCAPDLDQNGVIDVFDLVTVLENWDFISRLSEVIHS